MIRNLLFLLLPLYFFTACNPSNLPNAPTVPKAERILQPWFGDVNWWSWDGETPELLLGASSFEAPFLEKNWKAELNTNYTACLHRRECTVNGLRISS
jgi:hypothetical protein